MNSLKHAYQVKVSCFFCDVKNIKDNARINTGREIGMQRMCRVNNNNQITCDIGVL